ncbi:MAG TPA: nitroreductase/quinone reductase family protein [Acidimicrobiales bacterium]|nr:nitroreductase/quinone reductase family protein [Acidimicrobiales bacterium]
MARERRLVRLAQRYVVNPPTRLLAGAGRLRDDVLPETTGRVTGKRRHTPAGARLFGDELSMVSEHGHRSPYAHNIDAGPHVRVQVRGRWWSGVAHLLDHDDAHARLAQLWRGRADGAAVRLFGTDLLTIRIDLVPDPAHQRT